MTSSRDRPHTISSERRPSTTSSGDRPRVTPSGDRPHGTSSGDRPHTTSSGSRSPSTSGPRPPTTFSGDRPHATSSGDRPHATSPGDRPHTTSSGSQSPSTSGPRPPTTSSGDRTHPFTDVFREGQMPRYSSPSSETSATMTGEFDFSAGDPYPEQQPSASVPLSSSPRSATDVARQRVLTSSSPSSEGSSENAGFQRNVLMRLSVIEEQVKAIYGFMQAQASATLIPDEADPMPNPAKSIEDLEQLCHSLEEPHFYRMMKHARGTTSRQLWEILSWSSRSI